MKKGDREEEVKGEREMGDGRGKVTLRIEIQRKAGRSAVWRGLRSPEAVEQGSPEEPAIRGAGRGLEARCSPSALDFGRCELLSPASTSCPDSPDAGPSPLHRTLLKVIPFKECRLASFPHLVPKIALVASASKAAL